MAAQDSVSDSQDESSSGHQPKPESRQRRQLPKWLDHFNVLDLKTFLRCWISTWVATLLIFIHPVLTEIGQATFFAAIATYIVPPANILFVHLLAAITLLLGMCLAWCWGLLAMKAAYAVRSDADTQARLQALQQQAAVNANATGQPVAWEAQILVHEGFMLDARVTVIFFVMCCSFIYALARLRCANPKFVLTQIFGTIVIDLFLLFGPTLPKFTGSLASLLVKPGAIGIGIGIVCCILFFPRSTSFVVLGQQAKLIRMLDKSLETTRRRLADEPVPPEELQGARADTIALFTVIQPSLAFLPLDISRGRWNADDVQGLQEQVRRLMFTSLALLDFQITRLAAVQREENELQTAISVIGPATEKHEYEIGRRHRLESAKVMKALRSPELEPIRDQTRSTLRDTTAEVLRISSESIELVAGYISTVNHCRWLGKPTQQKFEELATNLRTTLTQLRDARETSVANTTKGILETHADLFDESGLLKFEETGRPFLPSIIISMVVEERIVGVAMSIEKLLEYIIQLTETRQIHRFWIPSRLRYAISWILNGRSTISVSGSSPGGGLDDPSFSEESTSLEDQEKEGLRRLRVSQHYPGSSAQRRFISRVIIKSFTWLFNPGGMFALRMVVVTIATGIPAVLPRTAGFFYREKGIWAVISAQTCLVVYMADLTFSIVTRGLGTVIGGVLGMVAWYIGSGGGEGNPYGMAAITAFMSIFLVWWRIFLPPAFAMATIMCGATFALIVGYSYDMHHLQQYGLPGTGYVSFWKRMVTVQLGFLASVIVQLFPSPPSATDHVCKTLSNTVRTMSDHYALLISHWGKAEQNGPLEAVAEQISIEVAENLMSLNGSIAILKGELSFGQFNSEVLKKTQQQCQFLNQAIGGLLHLATALPKELQDRLVFMVGILDDRAIGDIMAVLGIIEQALRTGSPLPERLPAPLVKRLFETYQNRDGGPMLSKELVRDENYRRYCVAVSLYLKFLTTIDDLLLVLKAALGERHIIYQWEEV